jgi:iron complex transport system ATP-binding protein
MSAPVATGVARPPGDAHHGAVSADLVARDVGVELDGTRILQGVSVTAVAGEWLAILGPNGAGKSTLLRALADLVPATGTITIAGRPVATMSRRERARLLALVPQDPVVPPGMGVTDYVLLGRTPHIAHLGTESARDLEVVGEALEELDLGAFRDRRLDSLSGGERQRVVIARALAQDAPVLLLDEPTTALDVGHQQEVLELIDHLRHTKGLTVVSTMHDLTLAGQFADRLVMLDRGRVATAGRAGEVLTEENLARYYGARVRVIIDDGVPIVVPVRHTP